MVFEGTVGSSHLPSLCLTLAVLYQELRDVKGERVAYLDAAYEDSTEDAEYFGDEMARAKTATDDEHTRGDLLTSWRKDSSQFQRGEKRGDLSEADWSPSSNSWSRFPRAWSSSVAVFKRVTSSPKILHILRRVFVCGVEVRNSFALNVEEFLVQDSKRKGEGKEMGCFPTAEEYHQLKATRKLRRSLAPRWTQKNERSQP